VPIGLSGVVVQPPEFVLGPSMPNAMYSVEGL
jgi:hypothetical protein